MQIPKTCHPISKNLLIAVTLLLSVAFHAQKSVMVEVSDKKDSIRISKHIYGHFAEHLGRCIYDGFYVGDSSSIPNIAGVRKDIIAALKDLDIPNLRWPGGCFADTYHWKNGIGKKSERPTIVNTWWGGVTEDNSFGTHDFLNLCEELGAEPIISGNVGSGTVLELAEWIQYTNFDGVSPMSDLRRQNGREKPWGVRFWGVGNETWGCGGNMRPEYYADVYRNYATFMSGRFNNANYGGIYKIASGPSGSNYRWTEVLMKNIPHSMMQGIALHHYAIIDWNNKSSATAFSEEQYFMTMKQAWRTDELIQKHTAIMDKHDPKKKVDIVVDEWGGWYDVEEGTNPGFLYQQNTMRDALLAGLTLNIFNSHADRVKMANLAQTVNVLQAVVLTEGNKILLTPTYHVMHMYKVHQDAKLLNVTFDSPDYELNDKKLPAISISASKNKEENIHISLVNIDSRKAHKVQLDLKNMDRKDFSATILTSRNLQDHNTFEDSNRVKPKAFKEFKHGDGMLKMELPPYSVVVFSGK